MKAPDQWIVTQIGGNQPPQDISCTFGYITLAQMEKSRLQKEPNYKRFKLVIRRKVAFANCPVMKKYLHLI